MKLGTWEKVAQELSEEAGFSISSAAVWKVAVGESRSPKVIQALGLNKRRYRRTAEFSDLQQATDFDNFLSEHNITLTELCHGLLTGSFTLLRQR
jgi:hypothetical protein